MECEAHGNPTPKFRWSKDGRRFDPNGDPNVKRRGDGSGTFTVDMAAVVAASAESDSEAAEAYEGVYRCSAENQDGTTLTPNITVRLARAPLWPREQLEPVMATEGLPAVLRCRPPQGFPPPIVFWMDGSMERVPLDGRVSQGLDGDLFFANVLLSDGDDYVCYAHFPHAGTIQKQPLTLTVQPSEWRHRGDRPTPRVSWVKVSGELPQDHVTFGDFNRMLVIRHASLSDAGVYQCRAGNSEGQALHTVTVTVEAKPYWIAPGRVKHVYAPWDSVKLACLANGIPKPVARWFINGVPIDEAPAVPWRSVDGDFLTLRGLHKGYTAMYQCESSNRHGTILANVIVQVLGKPLPTVAGSSSEPGAVPRGELAWPSTTPDGSSSGLWGATTTTTAATNAATTTAHTTTTATTNAATTAATTTAHTTTTAATTTTDTTTTAETTTAQPRRCPAIVLASGSEGLQGSEFPQSWQAPPEQSPSSPAVSRP
ncbi:neurofascin-like, partial [Lethenteron reissneri]|uniref:neurofascin-like n=1 Tax=Lethenteron reissneri TaxID=7753 RepID=UPI002AB5EBAD